MMRADRNPWHWHVTLSTRADAFPCHSLPHFTYPTAKHAQRREFIILLLYHNNKIQYCPNSIEIMRLMTTAAFSNTA
jgi:hypothetical protein